MSEHTAINQLQELINELETDLGIDANTKLPLEPKPASLSSSDPQLEEKQPKQEVKKGKSKGKSSKPSKTPVVDENQPEVTKLDMRVGRIVKVWKHETADKLYCEEIDVGEDEPRHIASGLVYHYTLEEMQADRLILVLCNLKPRNLVGFRSHGMVMCAATKLPDGNEKVAFVEPPKDAKIGERITFEGLSGKPFTPAQVEKKKVLEKLGEDMKTNGDGIAMWKEYSFQTSAGPCKAPNVSNGLIR